MKNINFFKKFKDKKGHYVVEASIILPIFLIGIITLSALINTFMVYENIVFSSVDECRHAMVNNYMVKEDIKFPKRLENRLIDENENIALIDIDHFISGYKVGKNNNLVSLRVNYKLDVKAPLPLIKTNEKKQTLVFRKFLGQKSDNLPFTFERMENLEEDNIVYIFPNDGIRYHKKECSYVTPKVEEKILDSKIKSNYIPCNSCGTIKAKFGDVVYIFKEYGDAYHYKKCSTIKKNFIKLDKQAAIKKGYTPCSKCGG